MNTKTDNAETRSLHPLVSGRTVWWTHHWCAGNESGTHRLPFLLQAVSGENSTVINDVGFVSSVKTCDLTQDESANDDQALP